MTDWIVNPETNRMVKVGSQTYRKLVNQGVLKNSTLDSRVLASYDETDDVDELKRQLSHNLGENEIISKGKGRYKNKLIKSYKGRKGRRSKRPPTPPPSISSDSEIEQEQEDLTKSNINFDQFLQSIMSSGNGTNQEEYSDEDYSDEQEQDYSEDDYSE